MMIKTIIVSAFSAIGNTKTPFFIKIFTTLLNLLLNYVLIFGVFFAPLDIVGIALSNLIATHIEMLILLWLLAKKSGSLRLDYFLARGFLKKG